MHSDELQHRGHDVAPSRLSLVTNKPPAPELVVVREDEHPAQTQRRTGRRPGARPTPPIP